MPTTSTWMADTSAEPSHPPLTGTTAAADVAVVGAGIVGTTVAHLLAAGGVDVALIEADRVGAGVSGHTTGKVSSLNGTVVCVTEFPMTVTGKVQKYKLREQAIAQLGLGGSAPAQPQ